jgi:hypothetical protein
MEKADPLPQIKPKAEVDIFFHNDSPKAADPLKVTFTSPINVQAMSVATASYENEAPEYPLDIAGDDNDSPDHPFGLVENENSPGEQPEFSIEPTIPHVPIDPTGFSGVTR